MIIFSMKGFKPENWTAVQKPPFICEVNRNADRKTLEVASLECCFWRFLSSVLKAFDAILNAFKLTLPLRLKIALDAGRKAPQISKPRVLFMRNLNTNKSISFQKRGLACLKNVNTCWVKSLLHSNMYDHNNKKWYFWGVSTSITPFGLVLYHVI